MKIIKKIKCPCCGYYTIEGDDEVIVDICPICYWQYDAMSHNDINKKSGANGITLKEARQNYKKYKVCKKDLKRYVRKPLEEEK